MDDEENKRTFRIFGRDISKIPCYRESLMAGIGGGFVGGLTYFLFTSNVRNATHASMGTFMATTLIYWIRCRYIYFEELHQLRRIQAGLNRKLMAESQPVGDLTSKLDLDINTDLKSA